MGAPSFNLSGESKSVTSDKKPGEARPRKVPSFNFGEQKIEGKLHGNPRFLTDEYHETYVILIARARRDYNQFKKGEIYHYLKLRYIDMYDKPLSELIYRVFMEYNGNIYSDHVETHNKANFDRIFEDLAPNNVNFTTIKINK